MGKTYETNIKLGAEFDKRFSPTMSAAEKKLAQLGKAAEGLKKSALAAKRFELLTGEVAKGEIAFAAARAELDRLAAEMAATENPSDALKASFKAQQKAVKDAERALERKRNTLRKVGGSLKDAGVDSARMGEEQKRLARQFQRTQLRMEGMSQVASAKLGPNLRKVGAELKNVALAGAALAGAALWKMEKEAVSSETALAKLSTAETVTDEQLRATAAAAKAWTEAHGGDDAEFIGAAYNAVSGGLTDTATSIAAVEQAQKLATATFAEGGSAMKALTKLYNNVGDKTKPASVELERLSDVLARTQAVADIADLDQLTEGLKYAMPAGLAFKVQLEQTAAALGALNTAGMEGSQAGTAYAASLSAMSKAAKTLKKYDKKFKIVKDEKTGGVDYLATIKAMEPALAAAEKKGISAGDVLTKAFGQEGMRAISLLRDNIDAVTKESLAEVAGTTERAFGKMDRTTAADLARIKASWDNAFAEAGRELLPIVKEYLPEIKQGIKDIPGVLKGLLAAAKDIASFVESVGGIKTILAGIAAVKLAGVASALVGVAKSVVQTAGGFGKILASTGPLGDMAGKFGAAGAAIGSWALAISTAIDAYREWKDLQAAEERNERIDAKTTGALGAVAARAGHKVQGPEAVKAAAGGFMGAVEVGRKTAERRQLEAALKGAGVDTTGARGNLVKLRAAADKAGIARPTAGGGGTVIQFRQEIHVQGGAQAGPDVRAAGTEAAQKVEDVLRKDKRRAFK